MVELLALIAGTLGVIWLLIKGKQSGEESERLRQHENNAEQREKAREADKVTDSLDTDAKREWLRKHTNRD